MAFRNPFDRFGGPGYHPTPRSFSTPNHGRSMNDEMLENNPFSYPSRAPIENPSRQAPEAPTNSWKGYLDELRSAYTTEGPAAKSYREHLSSVPQMEKPGGWHRFGAALTGLGAGLQGGAAAGWEAGQKALTAPYRQSMDEWSVREQALSRQADIEDSASNRRVQFLDKARQFAKDEHEMRKWMDEYELEEEKLRSLDDHRRAQRDHWRSQGYKTRFDSQGNEIMYHPSRPNEQVNLGQSSKAGDWLREDRRGDIAEFNARTSRGQLGVSARNAATNEGRLRLSQSAEERLQGRERRYENSPISASEQATARFEAINRVKTEDPTWAKFVDKEGNINTDNIRRNPRGFEQFMQRVRAAEAEIYGLRRNRSADVASPDDDDVDLIY